MTMTTRMWCGLLAAVCVCALATACSNDSAKPSGSASESSAAPDVPKVVFDGTADVSGGRQLKVRCVGAGSPTVLLEVGGSGDMSDWPSTFVDALGAETTTCLYSRAGGPGSTPVDGLQTRAQLVDDADTLLDSLHKDHGVQGPFVLVGWSLGGSVALAETLEHPDTTAGLVILDTNFPADFVPACVKSGHSAKECQASYDEDEEAKAIEKDIVAEVHPLPDIPIAIVSALQQPDCLVESGATSVTAEIAGTDVTAPDCEALGVVIADKNRSDWGQLGPQVTDTRLDADHDNLPREASAEIAALVLQMVTTAR